MDELKNRDGKAEPSASADDLLKQLNNNIKESGKGRASGTIGKELEGIKKKLNINETEPSKDIDDDFLSDFFAKEFSEFGDDDDEAAHLSDNELIFEDINDDFISKMLNGNETYVADHSDLDESTKIAGYVPGTAYADPEIPDLPEVSAIENDILSKGSLYDDISESGDDISDNIGIAYNEGVTDTDDIGDITDITEEDMDHIDKELMFAFGQSEELKEKIGKDKLDELSESRAHDGEFFERAGAGIFNGGKSFKEYESADEAESVIKEYEKKHKGAILRFASVSVLMLFSLIIENISKIGIKLPEIFNPTVYPVVYLMIELQILLLGAAIVYNSIFSGFRSVFKGKPSPESLISVSSLSALVCISAVAAAFPLNASGIYIFPIMLGLWFLSLGELLSVKREIMSFSVISSKSHKFALSKLNIESSELETETFYDYLPDKPSMYRICKTDFVSNFFRRCSESVKSKKVIGIALPAAFIISFAFFFIGMAKSGSAGDGLVTAYTAIALCTPAVMLLAFSYPMFKASKNAFSDGSAIVGEKSIDEYSEATAVSFDDKEVFPSYGVKVRSVKIYGKNRIDRVIYNTASVFDFLGGPLSDVFDVATVELGKSENVEICEIRSDGIGALVDGKRICIGKANYISDLGLTPYYDMEDDQAETAGDVSIMYVVCDEQVAAKMYVQYIVEPDFEILLKELRNTGVCVGIKTLDPNIDDNILNSRINLQKYPVRIIRCRALDDMNSEEKSIDSGVVSKNSQKSLLKLIAVCDKAGSAMRTNSVIGLFSLGIGILITAFLLLTDMMGGISSFLIGLYHIFWALPILLTSKTLS